MIFKIDANSHQLHVAICHIGNHRPRLILGHSAHHRHARLDDASLLAGDLRVSASWFVWSKLILVIALTSGRQTLVLSKRPPIPTSITAKSTWRTRKYKNAMAVVISK